MAEKIKLYRHDGESVEFKDTPRNRGIWHRRGYVLTEDPTPAPEPEQTDEEEREE